MKKIDYAFKVDGFYDSVNYYRSESPMQVDAMPAPTATGISELAYSDETAESYKKYYARFSTIKNSVEKISSEVEIYTYDEPPNLAVMSLMNFESGLVDVTSKRTWVNDSSSIVSVSTTKARFGTKSLRIARTSATGAIGIRTANSDDFWFDDLDFGIEMSINIVSLGNYNVLLSQRSDAGVDQSFSLYYRESKFYLTIITSDDASITIESPVYALSLNTWYDVQIAREAEKIIMAVNGSVIHVQTIGNVKFFKSSQPIVVAHLNTTTGGGVFDGYIDEFRVTKGIAPRIKPKTGAFTY